MEKKFGLCVIVTFSSPFAHSRSVDFYDLSEISLFDAVKIAKKFNSCFFDVNNSTDMTCTICFGHSVACHTTPDMSDLLYVAEHTNHKIVVERDLLGLNNF